MRRLSHASFEPIVTKFCLWRQVGNMITGAKFYGNRLRGFGVTGPTQTPFPILNVHRPYNSVSTTVLQCDTAVLCRKNRRQQAVWERSVTSAACSWTNRRTARQSPSALPTSTWLSWKSIKKVVVHFSFESTDSIVIALFTLMFFVSMLCACHSILLVT